MKLHNTLLLHGFSFMTVMGLILFAQSPASFADGPPFSLPIDCKIGKNCFIQNYVDLAAGPEGKDFQCNSLTYDGHTGTDIRLLDYPEMRQGISVIAAAAGKVRAIREGMEDVTQETVKRDEITGRFCGNAVVIDHDDGWSTFYCHMRKGSIAVKKDDVVQRGQKLGLVGNSGMAEFPHVHFEVMKGKTALDPFTGKALQSTCGAENAAPLWSTEALAALPYVRTGALVAGFSDRVPTRPEIRDGAFATTTFTRKSPAIIFWAEVFGKVAGDKENVLITAPSGKNMVASAKTATKNEATSFMFLGDKIPPSGWEPGKYKASYILTRSVNGQAPQPVIQIERTMIIE